MKTDQETTSAPEKTRTLIATAAPLVGLGTLHQNWITGGNDEVEFALSCGAGLGSPYLFLSVEKGGHSVTEKIDIRDMLTDWVSAVAAEMNEAQPDEAEPAC